VSVHFAAEWVATLQQYDTLFMVPNYKFHCAFCYCWSICNI